MSDRPLRVGDSMIDGDCWDGSGSVARGGGPTAQAPAAEPARVVIHGRSVRIDRTNQHTEPFDGAAVALARRYGCTDTRAGQALLRVGSLMGLRTCQNIATWFTACLEECVSETEVSVFIAAVMATPKSSVDVRVLSAAGSSPDGRSLSMRGELDIHTAPLLAAAFERRNRTPAVAGTIVLDLFDVTLIDLTGLGLLFDIHAELAAAGDHLSVYPPSAIGPRRMVQLASVHSWIAPLFGDAAASRPLAASEDEPPCMYCRAPVPSTSFLRWPDNSGRRSASCPRCRRVVTLPLTKQPFPHIVASRESDRTPPTAVRTLAAPPRLADFETRRSLIRLAIAGVGPSPPRQ